jgi:hypothetical protein
MWIVSGYKQGLNFDMTRTEKQVGTANTKWVQGLRSEERVGQYA